MSGLLDGAEAGGPRERLPDLAEQLLQPGGYLPVPADRDQMHSVECARVTELDDLIAGCLDARETISPHPFAQAGGNVDVGDHRCHPLGVRLAGQDHHAREDRDLGRVGVPPPQQCVNREADLCEQEVSGLLPGRQGAQGRGGPVARPDEFGEREDWSRIWTPGVLDRKKVVTADDGVWEDTPLGHVRVMNSAAQAGHRQFSVDVYELTVPAGSRSGKYWKMADETVYVLDGSGYSLHWEVEAEIAEKYYARRPVMRIAGVARSQYLPASGHKHAERP